MSITKRPMGSNVVGGASIFPRELEDRSQRRRDAHNRILGRETEVLDALGIPWQQAGHRHIRCPFPDHEDKHPSWRWDQEKRAWTCSCNDRGYSSVFDAVIRMRGGTFKEACSWVDEALRLPPEKQPPAPGTITTQPVAQGDEPRKMQNASEPPHICPDKPATKQQCVHSRFGMPVSVYPYYNTDDKVHAVVARYNHADGSKDFVPWMMTTGGRWIARRAPGPWPLFRLRDMLSTEEPVLLVEGEGVVLAAEKLFPDWSIVTTSGGSKHAHGSDFSSLKGRSVTIWPDNDHPRPPDKNGEVKPPDGIRYANDVARLALEAGAAEVRTVDVPLKWPDGWDLADGVPVDSVDLREMLDEAKAWQPQENTAPPKTPDSVGLEAIRTLIKAAPKVQLDDAAGARVTGPGAAALLSEPRNLEAERILLGSAMADNQVYEALADRISPLHFSDPLHGQTWKAIGALVSRGKRAEAASILPQINERVSQGDITVEDFLGAVRLNVRSLDEIGSFAEAVLSAAHGRSVIRLCDAYKARARSGPPGLLESFSRDVTALAGGDKPETYAPISGDVHRRREVIRAKHRMAPGTINGLSTGFPKLDKLTDGLRPKTLTVIGARPKNGKTAFGCSAIQNMSKAGIPVCFFSLEMPRDEIIDRFIAMEAEVDFVSMKRGMLTEEEQERVEVAANSVNSWPLIIDDASSLTPSTMAIRARHAVKVDGAKAVFIDYLQRLRPERIGKRYEEVTAISMAIADLRKTIGVPIVAMAQLNRRIIERGERVDFAKFSAEMTRPNDADLRDSGQIEQDADTLIFINRPEMQLEHLEPTEESKKIDWEAACAKWRGRAEISVFFNRGGPTGFIDFRFHRAQMRFQEATR